MIEIIALIFCLFTIHRVDGRRVKNIHYLSNPSNHVTISNRVEYISLPLRGQKCGTIPYEKLSDLDKQFLEAFWAEIKKHKVNVMRKDAGLKKFSQINQTQIEVFTAKKKIEIAHTPSGENHTLSINIPHSWLTMWDNIKEL